MRLATDLDGAVNQSLARAAVVLGAKAVALTLEDSDEPWVDLAVWEDGAVRRSRAASAEWQPLLNPDLEGFEFLRADASGNAVHMAFSDGQPPRTGPAVTRAFHARFGKRSAVALRIPSEYYGAVLLAIDVNGRAAADVALVRAVGEYMGDMLDRIYRAHAVREAALLEERTRLARELHDGVVQSLTSASLRLKAAEQILGTDAAAALEHVRAVQRLLAEEQRDLRAYVADLKPRALEISGEQPNVDLWLRELADRIGSAWDIAITVTTHVGEALAAPLTHGVYRIAQEAMVNSARHGHATHADVALRQVGRHVTLVVADNGRAFSFRGTFEHEELLAQRLGPVNLKERVLELGGKLRIISSDGGARLEVELPLTTAPA